MSISRCDLLTRFRKLHAGETAWCSVILDSGLVLYPIKKLDCCWRPEGCPRRNAANWKIYDSPWVCRRNLGAGVHAFGRSAGTNCERRRTLSASPVNRPPAALQPHPIAATGGGFARLYAAL